MGINIKLYSDIFSLLDIELFDSVFTKDTEDTFAGILPRHFNYILLRLPVNSIIKCFILLNFSFSRGEITKNSLKSIIFC